MSDNYIEDGIRDNAGHLALAGALMAHSQRRQQLQSLEASRQHQAQIARTESERLEVEKKRLKLERLKQQADKEEKEAVRQLRVLMAEVGGDFEFLSNRGDFKGAPQGIRRDYAMAVLLSKLALVRSRSDSLSDLNDLKELISLENSAQEFVAKHFAGRDPLEIARSKWLEIEAWMHAVEQMEQEVKQQCSVVPQASALQLPSKDELAEMRRKLEDNLAKLTPRLQAQLDCLPVDVVASGMVLSDLTEQATMDDLREDKKGSRSAVFAKRWEQVAVIKRNLDPGMAVVNDIKPRLVQNLESALANLRQWQDRLTEHEQVLQRLASDLEAGRLSEAVVCDKKLSEVKFSRLNYQPVADLQSLESALKELKGAKRGKAARLVKELRAMYPKAGTQTELIQELNKHQARSASEKRKALLVAVIALGLAAGLGKMVIDNEQEQQRIAAEAKAKAEVERLAFERIATEAQVRLSKEVQSGAVGGKLEIPLSSSVNAQLCFIPSGSFTMGSPSSEDSRSSDEGQVEVTLSQPFWLAKTEVTQAQWEAVMGSNPSQFKGANLPVENVSWDDAQSFVAKLNDKQILPQGWKFALPTEAQWEYACRAGEKGPYSGGSLDEVGWYDGNSGSKTNEVSQKKPNAWGLHDMHGNVYEWCADWYSDTLNGGVDPTGLSSGDDRVFRGGSWYLNASYCRAAYRRGGSPGHRGNRLGFRPALVPSK